MRRLCATLGIVVLSLAVCPARADAYFWAWLDELSGPHFIGFLVEWRVYCKAESVAQERQSLVKLNARSAEGVAGAYGRAENGD